MGSQRRLLVRCRPVSFNQGVSLDLDLAVTVNVVLNTKECVARALEDTADLEGPGDGSGRGEKPVKLHGITNDPTGDNRQSESLAGLCAQIGKYLGDREGRFHRETDGTDGAGVDVVETGNVRQEQFENDEAGDKVHDAMPETTSAISSSPSTLRLMFKILTAWARAIARNYRGVALT